MLAVAGMWELGWSAPLTELNYWKYPLRDLGVQKMYMSPVSGIHVATNSSFIVEERAQFSDILDELRGQATLVFVDERGEYSLPGFNHPPDAVYVFGKANFSPLLSLMQPGDLSVAIPTVKNTGSLWPHQAASIVLYDRLLKS